MSRSQKKYTIEIQYPKTSEEMLYIRKKLGAAYLEFVKEYLASLSIDHDEKTMIYNKVLQKFKAL